MKIQIRQLLWNPFRDIDEYPINKDKVNGLVKSILQTSFWDNILARESPSEKNKFEIAYGHHRLLALHKIFGVYSRHLVDIPVRDLDDPSMLKIMANENAAAWTMDTAVVMETIKATEKFLFPNLSGKIKRHDEPVAEKITSFLGGVFSETMVQEALALIHAIDAKEVDAKAVKIIEQPSKAAVFMRAVKDLPEDKKPTPEKQRDMAKRIVENETPKSQIKENVQFAAGIYPHTQLEKPIPDVSTFMWQHRAEVDRLAKYLNALADDRDSIPNGREWISFRAACALLTKALNRLFSDEQQKEGFNGTQKERRALQQRSARALPSR